MHRKIRWAGAILALVAFLITPASATVKNRLRKLLQETYGVPVKSMTAIGPLTLHDDEPLKPTAFMPALTLQQLVCRLVGVQNQCHIAELEVCPMNVVMQQGGGDYRCDVDCHGVPPNNGICDCDVKLDTCKPL